MASYADVAASGPKQTPEEVRFPRLRSPLLFTTARDRQPIPTLHETFNWPLHLIGKMPPRPTMGKPFHEMRYLDDDENDGDDDADWDLVAPAATTPLPLQAAAPPQPEIVPSESTASTGSLIDVDTQSVRTVPSDFMDQPVQTETQAARLDREAALEKERAVAAERKAKAAANKARRADNWLAAKIAALSDGQASAVVYANLAAVVGLSAVAGYKAWALHERGALTWKTAGIGAAVVGAVGLVEGVFSRYIFRSFLPRFPLCLSRKLTLEQKYIATSQRLAPPSPKRQQSKLFLLSVLPLPPPPNTEPARTDFQHDYQKQRA